MYYQVVAMQLTTTQGITKAYQHHEHQNNNANTLETQEKRDRLPSNTRSWATCDCPALETRGEIQHDAIKRDPRRVRARELSKTTKALFS